MQRTIDAVRDSGAIAVAKALQSHNKAVDAVRCSGSIWERESMQCCITFLK